MKIVQVCFVAMAVALVACVSHAGLFDAIKSVDNEAANVADGVNKVSDADTKAPEAVSNQPQTSPDDQARVEIVRRRNQEEDAEKRRAAEENAAAEARRQAENARKAKQSKTVAALASWEKRLKEFGYSSEQIAELLVKIKQLTEDGFATNDDMVMGLLHIRDQREVAKDAAAAKKINLNDPKTLSENDKIIIAHIDQELVSRLMLQGAVSKQEIDQLKIQLLVAIHKVQEDLQVQVADLQIKEIIRMHNL